jgi:osmotically inducible lipoprotein OsmB
MRLMNRTMKLALIVGGVAFLAGCGHSEPNRAAGGAGVGAGTGAVAGAIAGPPGMAVGALVGAGVGAAGGAATSPSQVNLGKPVWQQPMHVGGAQYNPQ